jgi:hypothetical protein
LKHFKKLNLLIFGHPEASIPNVSIGIITKTGTLLCLDDTNTNDRDFSRASMLKIRLFPATERNLVMKRPRLKGGIIETLRKKLRLRFVLCSRKQDFKENPPGWKKLPPVTPRQPHPITPVSVIFVSSPSSEIFLRWF